MAGICLGPVSPHRERGSQCTVRMRTRADGRRPGKGGRGDRPQEAVFAMLESMTFIQWTVGKSGDRTKTEKLVRLKTQIHGLESIHDELSSNPR